MNDKPWCSRDDTNDDRNDRSYKVVTLLVVMAGSTFIVIAGLIVGAKQLSYAGLAVWLILLSAVIIWLLTRKER